MSLSSGPAVAERMLSMLVAAMADAGSGNPQRALDSIDKLLRTYDGSGIPECEISIADALYNKGVLLRDLGRRDEGLGVWSGMARRFADHRHPRVLLSVTRALFNYASSMRTTGQVEEALQGYKHTAARVRVDAATEMQEVFGLAGLNEASLYLELDRHDAALLACDRVIKRFSGRTEPALFGAYVTARGNKAEALGAAGREVEALEFDLRTVSLLERTDSQEFLEAEAIARNNAAATLMKLHRVSEAAAAYSALIERFEGRQEPVVKQQVGKALLHRASALGKLGRYDEALRGFAETVERIGPSKDPVLVRCVEVALGSWASSLEALGRTEALSEVESAATRLNRRAESLRVHDQVAHALVDQAQTSPPAERSELFNAVALDALETDGADSLEVAALLLDKAASLASAERYEGMLDPLHDVLRLLGTRRDHLASVLTARALDGIGGAHVRLEQYPAAEAAFRELLQRFPGQVHQEIGQHLLRAQHALSMLQRREEGPPPSMLCLRAVTPLPPDRPDEPFAQYLHAELQQEPPLLQLEYAAGRAGGITGTAMLLSLFKRLRQDQGVHFRSPDIVIFFPPGSDTPHLSDPDCEGVAWAQFSYGDPPAELGELRDANHELLVEALATFGLPLEQALQCTHISGSAALLGYECTMVTVHAGRASSCFYQPIGKGS